MVFCSSLLTRGDVRASGDTIDAGDWLFQATLVDKSIVFESYAGTAWKKLTWGWTTDEKQIFFLDYRGVYSSMRELPEKEFALVFQIDSTTVTVRSFQDADWKQCRMYCKELPCEFYVAQVGLLHDDRFITK